MKKLLLTTFLFSATFCIHAQNNIVKPQPNGKYNMAKKISRKFDTNNSSMAAKPAAENVTTVSNPAPKINEQALSVAPTSTISWKMISGSSNCYGQLESHSKPLQYNADLKAVSFIHRKSESYTETPAAAANYSSGVIVADISTDLGITWDSTCIWNNSTNAGRYPQGAIYSAPGNTNIANAYVVGSGPTLGAVDFSGNWYASKKLAAAGSTLYNSTADATPMAQQFVDFATSKNSWARYGFTAVSDGVVRSLALVQGNNIELGDAAKMRGVTVVKGVYAAGVFNWTYNDSILPSTYTLSVLQGTNTGVKVLSPQVQMAFNQSGQIGYVVMLGAASTATGANKGYQPIIYKTTNGGTSWTSISSIDFALPTMSIVTNPLAAVSTNSNLSIPYFNQFDLAVDASGRLHIGAIIASTASNHNDSLAYVSQFTADQYMWKHTPGFQPYIYDFIGDGASAWKVITVDSMWSEDPGADPSQPGFATNPWDVEPGSGTKLNIDPRLQLSRTPDGNYITFSWAESDTNFILGLKKWNVIPDIKTRCMSAVNGTYAISINEINVSKVAAGNGTNNIQVAGKAFLHYMAPINGGQTSYTTATTLSVDINMPFTVTNSAPLSQLTNNRNWYGKSKLSFYYGYIGGIQENNLNTVIKSHLFPNPANNSTTLAIELNDNASVTCSVYNVVGQLLKIITTNAQAGENNIELNLQNLSSGIYMVKINVGGESSTKKLIIE